MIATNIEAALRRISLHGPDRVVITDGGEAISPKRALFLYGIGADIIFVRQDGWSLGAPERLRNVAYSQWKDQWVGFLKLPGNDLKPISEYQL